MRASRGWIVVAALVVVAGWVLRAWHLGTPSLWWDEIVQLRMVDEPSVWSVINRVRLGVPVGSGNAGAVPLDYVLLWAWLQSVPMPAPEHLETYVRTPSFVWSCLLPPLLGWWTWRHAGMSSGLATTLLAAASIPLVLYAAEARFYSLFCLMTVLNLAAFMRVVATPDDRAAWLAYGTSAVLLFLSGLFGLLVLPWQLVTLLVLGRRRARSRHVGAIFVLVTALVVVVGAYFAATNLGTQSTRGLTRLPWGKHAAETLRFFGFAASALPWALGLGPFVAIGVTWRRSPVLARVLLCATTATVVAVPVMLELAEAKHHFYHPRHALFLLPPLLAMLGIALGSVADTLAPRRLAPLLALVGAFGLVAPAVRHYLDAPAFYFNRIKDLHEFRELTQELRARTRDYGPNDRYLLISTRGRGGHLGNPVLAWYLEWYGIRDRVLLTGTTTPADTMARTRTLCRTRCRRLSAIWMRQLGLVGAYQLTPPKRRLLGAPVLGLGRYGDPRDIGFLVYPPLDRWNLGPLRGYRPWRRRGLHLYELVRPPLPR